LTLGRQQLAGDGQSMPGAMASKVKEALAAQHAANCAGETFVAVDDRMDEPKE
jgi:hypothetical protein